MKRSTDRILTTHVGSLSRPDALVSILTAKDRGQPFDLEAYTRLVREAVAEYATREQPRRRPRSIGAGSSRTGDVSERAEALLAGLGKRK